MPKERQSAEPRRIFQSASADSGVGLEPWLIALLACPVDHAPVLAEGNELVCNSCRRHYSVYDRIPVMIPAEPKSEQKF